MGVAALGVGGVLIAQVSQGAGVFLGAESLAQFVAESGMLQATFDDATNAMVPVGPPYQQESTAALVLILLGTTVVGPFVEEVAFRGLIYRGLRNVLVGRSRVLAVLLAALAQTTLFVKLHPADSMTVLVLGSLAVLWAVSFEVTGSLWVPIISHSLYNAVTIGLSMGGPHSPLHPSGIVWVVLACAPLLAAGLAWLCGRLLGSQVRIERPLSPAIS